MTHPQSGFYLPLGLLRDAGWSKVTDFDQYLTLIRDYVKKNPEYNGKPTIGFTTEADSWRIYVLKLAPGHLNGHYNGGGFKVDPNTYETTSYALDDITKNYMFKLNQLWNEGLCDKEMFSQNYDQHIAKIASGRVIGFYDERWQIQDAINSLEKQGLFDRIPFAMPVLEKGVTKDPYRGMLVAGIGAGVSISKDAKDPEFVFKFIDRMCGEDIQKLANWGIEGEDYSVQDGKMVKSEEQIKQFEDTEYTSQRGFGTNLMWWLFPHNAPGDMYSDGSGTIFWDQSEQYIKTKYKDYEKEFLKAYNLNTLNDMFAEPFKSPYGVIYDVQMTDDNPAKVVGDRSYDISNRMLPKVIMAKPGKFEEAWNEYVAEMNKLDWKTYNAYYTEQIRKRVAEWN